MPSSTHALFARTGVLAMVPVIASVYSVLAAAASTGSWDELGSAKGRSDDDDDDAPLLCFSDSSDDDDAAPLSVCLTAATTTMPPLSLTAILRRLRHRPPSPPRATTVPEAEPCARRVGRRQRALGRQRGAAHADPDEQPARLAHRLRGEDARAADGRVRRWRRARRGRVGVVAAAGRARQAVDMARPRRRRRRALARQPVATLRGRPRQRQVQLARRVVRPLHRRRLRPVPDGGHAVVDGAALLARVPRVDAPRRGLVVQPQGGARERPAARRPELPHALERPRRVRRRGAARASARARVWGWKSGEARRLLLLILRARAQARTSRRASAPCSSTRRSRSTTRS